ncbi:DUF89 domain-containing protein [Mycena belliarum]|uniref:Sugar phosphate phosphatase n=1 Tax=Mycena belliarum TaxID=1033014 RepID=A0AAD6TQA5_9AGAR|nr:DUF89 domain-containing protein [Mycena belliae]
MFTAPYPPYDPTDPAGFSYTTVVHRWPVIITGVIDRLHRASHELCLEQNAAPDSDAAAKAALGVRIEEAKGIIEKISKLKYEMGRNYAMQPIPADGEPADSYNAELARLAAEEKNTWFTAPWLFAECYLYRLLRSFFAQTTRWAAFDPFASQKTDTFRGSAKAIYQLATTMHELDAERATLQSDPDKLGVLFKEMIQMCLWGNATDLSLLTHLSAADIAALQTVGPARAAFILRDDQAAAWRHVRGLAHGRVDVVLDNAGFELFTDLVLADFLVTYTPHVASVVFHPKLIPWFVSDVTPADFADTISSLLDPSFLAPPEGTNIEHLERMVARWKTYVESGVFALSVPASTPLGGSAESEVAEFWTGWAPYWDMRGRARGLWGELRGSGLVIFKGDLNYRKLTGDVQWPAWTPFATALGPLAGSFPLLSLRTNKADVVVGVEREVAERLDKSGEKWRVDGRYALISFLAGGVE